MLVIGLTGGIATGKSTVSNKLKDFGACVIDADEIAKEIVKKEEKAWHKIKEYFGNNILLSSGEINRKALAAHIFNNADARSFLNQVTHPEILDRSQKLIKYYQNEGKSPLIVLDAPLLIESGAHLLVQKIWVVYCSKETQISRLMARDGLDYEAALARIASQMPLAEKLLYADDAINTEGSILATEQRIEELWKKYFGKMY